MILWPFGNIRVSAVSMIVIVASLTLLAPFYFSYINWTDLKAGATGWVGQVHRVDSELGYAPVPNSSGMLILSGDIKISVHYDRNGFRTDSRNLPNQLVGLEPCAESILALGCSFTFGFGVESQHTYCSQLAKRIGAPVFNAGRCSYGIAEMVLLARRLIPELKPKIVLIQYSPWLVDRSRLRYSPSFRGLLPHPYFFCDNHGCMKIHRPDFNSAIFDYDSNTFRFSSPTFYDFMNFSLTREFPLVVHDLKHSALVKLKEILKKVPEPEQNSSMIVSRAYGEIESLCLAYGSRMFVLVLGADNGLLKLPESFEKLNAKIIDSHAFLVNRPNTLSEDEYARLYYHWKTRPEAIIDRHPNAHAHQMIADSIMLEMSL